MLCTLSLTQCWHFFLDSEIWTTVCLWGFMGFYCSFYCWKSWSFQYLFWTKAHSIKNGKKGSQFSSHLSPPKKSPGCQLISVANWQQHLFSKLVATVMIFTRVCVTENPFLHTFLYVVSWCSFHSMTQTSAIKDSCKSEKQCIIITGNFLD